MLLLAGENPWPALVIAVLNLIVGLFLVGVSLSLGITISLLAWVHALADRGPLAWPNGAKRGAVA